jgi:alkylated DNA repair dioxygenase AlkB
MRARRYIWRMRSLAYQPSLLGSGAPSVDPAALVRIERVALDDSAWFEYLPGWVTGHETLFAELVATTAWRAERRPMYERVVDVPRLLATLPEDGPGHPLLEQVRRLLGARYGTEFSRLNLGYYRDGRDSVAWHGDTTARDLPEAVVATVSLGEPRRFLLRPREGGRARAFALGWGDLIVMGGSCQRTWRHAVPKVSHAGPRIAVMYRPVWPAPQTPTRRDSDAYVR